MVLALALFCADVSLFGRRLLVSLPERDCTNLPPEANTKGLLPGVNRLTAQFLFDPEELIVLGRPLTAAGSTGLDLPGIGRHREIGDGDVLGFTGAVRHDGRVRSEERR